MMTVNLHYCEDCGHVLVLPKSKIGIPRFGCEKINNEELSADQTNYNYDGKCPLHQGGNGGLPYWYTGFMHAMGSKCGITSLPGNDKVMK